MYAYFKRLDYFSTECVYAPFAARGFARDLVKDLEVGGVGVEWIVLEKVGGLIWVKVTDSIDVVHSAEPWTVAAAPLSPRPTFASQTKHHKLLAHAPLLHYRPAPLTPNQHNPAQTQHNARPNRRWRAPPPSSTSSTLPRRGPPPPRCNPPTLLQPAPKP